MPNLTQGDFKYLKNKLFKDKGYHEKEFLGRVNPDKIDLYYEGDPDRDEEIGTSDVRRMSLNHLFPATITLAAQFYPQNPQFIGIPKREGDELNAKIATAGMDYFYKEMNALLQNQLAITSGWLYGYGPTKQGWRTEFKQVPPVTLKPNTTQTFASKIKGFFSGGPNVEERESPDYIAAEGPWLNFVNPKDLYLDSEQPFGEGKYIHHHLLRSLYEVRTSGLYGLDDDFISKFKTSSDERESKLDLYETWMFLKDGMYIFTYCDRWEKPLRWDKSIYAAEGFPFRILTLTNQVNKVYPIPHAKIAQRLQRLDDYILTLQKKAIERYRDIMVWNKEAFDPAERTLIKKGKIGTNVFANSQTPGSVGAHFGGSNIPKDLYAIHEVVEENVKAILGVIGARLTGESEVETATQEKISDYGNQLRAMGMTGKIKEFLISQGKKLLHDMKQFADAPLMFKVTGLDLEDPETGELITEKWVEFASETSEQTLKEIIPQDLDIDLDITNRTSRDLAVTRKQMGEYMAMAQGLKEDLMAEGKRFSAYKFLKKIGETFETIDNADEFFDEVGPSPETTPIPGAMPPEAPGVPRGPMTPEGIEEALEIIPPGV